MRYLIGIGNYHGRDDSIGLRVAEHIGDAGLDVGFRAIDLGGNLLDAIHYLDGGTESVLFVDSARMGLDPGEFRFFTPDQVATVKDAGRLSTHEGDLLKVLEFASATGTALPPITILGVEPGDLGEGAGLSVALEARFAEYVEAAVGFMARGQA